ELLAALEHPGIARMYSAGVAQTGAGELPYLAMEYVRGADLLTHAQERALTTRQKLELVIAIARAVHHAHTRGAIHRDLKPANILVDEHGQPKILDFGVAHVTGRDDVTQMTVAGEILGTVPYMPPEQLGGQARAVDPSWDVYALGVIAYELLCGELPYPGMSKATVLTALQEKLSKAPVRLSKKLPQARGDLETIIDKAMASEAAQRYSSAAELAADLERFLESRPIEARPPTMRYVLGLFVRRHRAFTAAAMLVFAALIVATAVSAHFAYSASQRASEREAVNQFMQDMFAAADPERSLGEHLTVRDVLDVARSELQGGHALAPGATAQVQRTLANTYVNLGLAQQGIELLRSAQSASDELYGADSDEALQVRIELARALTEAGQEAEGEKLLQPMIAALAQAQGTRRRLLLEAQMQQADILVNQGKAADAEKLLRASLPQLEQVFGADDDLTLHARYNLAQVLHLQARYDESIAQAQLVVQKETAKRGAEHPRVQLARDVIAETYREQAKYAQAEAIYRDTVALREKVLGTDHPQTNVARVSLAAVLAAEGRAGEAAPIARQAHEGILRYLGPEAELTRNVASLRAYVVSEAGDWQEAAQINRELVTQDEERPSGPTETDLPDYNNLGNALKHTGRLDEAIAVYRKLLGYAEKIVGRQHLHYGLFELNYADGLIEQKRLGEARPLLEHSLAILRKELGDDHPKTKKAIDRLRAVYTRLGLKAQAAALPAA
ncbi:MAG TPA: serine/threonine-protein kinase, partial [Nevskiaceae bacterium]|nr:serine/threonine-protein kinase [Nevskiaceae bacterium]